MNLPLKNKKIFCRIKSFFASDRTKNILKSKKTKAIVVGLFLVAVFSLAFFVFSSDIVSAQNTIPNGQPSTKEKTGWVAGIGIDIIKAVLQLVEKFLSWVFGLTATLFGVVVSPGNISGDHGILNQPVIGEIWMMTRDTMNMFFILVLLFSAFCTIFQVEKWNLKKIWLNILINALLVNFSFPIARFFIDVSNVAMYYFINNLFDVTGADGSGIFAAISSNSSVTELLYKGAGSEIDKLVGQFSNIIFMFILVMTLLVTAVLFTIRLIFLTLLVMFSPIGFVGYIFPSTAKYADKWWENLFSYSFFGPIMIFGIAIAIKITQAFNANRGAFSKGGYTNAPSSSDANWVASAAFFVIPIIVLWVVMGIAKSMGIAGAEKVVNTAKKGGKALAMMGPGNWAKRQWEGFSKQRKARQEEKNKKNIGTKFGKELNNLQDSGIAWAGEKVSEGVKKATGGRYDPKLGERARSRVNSYKSTEFDEAAKKHAERIRGEEDPAVIASRLLDPTHTTITDSSSKSQVADFMGRYKEARENPVVKGQIDSEIRSNSANITAAFKAAKILADAEVAKGTFSSGSDEYKAFATSQQNAHMEKLVSTHWAELARQNKNAQKHTRGEKI